MYILSFPKDNTDPKPRIVTHPEALTVLVGENVTLRCVIMLKNNTVRVSWKRNNKPLSGARVVTRAQVTHLSKEALKTAAPQEDTPCLRGGVL